MIDKGETLLREMLTVNMRRGRILAIIIIGFELIIAAADVCASILKVDNRFLFNDYLIMYIIMIFINAAWLLLIHRFKDFKDSSINQLKRMELYTVVYVILIMSWGSIIALMDQKLYGNLTAFMVNMITCSVLFYLDNKKILIPYACSVLILFIGLPYSQKSQDVLIGHYINLIFFVVIAWFASRIVFLNYYDDFKVRDLLNKSNRLLEEEIELNKNTNMKLTFANYQLSTLSLIDELTGIPNRRSFRNYIDLSFESRTKEDCVLSVIMIDIDLFKEFNDNYGHNEGDKVLIAVANVINSVVSHTRDFAARWGGEEFIFASFNTNEEYIGTVAELIRQKVYSRHIPHEHSNVCDYISVSLGISTMNISGIEDVSKAIDQADKALYLAKRNGRNCVKMEKNN